MQAYKLQYKYAIKTTKVLEKKTKKHTLLSLVSPLSVMELQFPFSLTTFLLLLFIFMLVKQCKISKAKNSLQKFPPGPWKLPLIGNMHHLGGILTHRSLRELARKHGALMHLQLGEVSAVVVSSPKLAKEIMKTNDIAFAQRPELLASKIFSYGGTDIAYSPYGDYWRQMRKVCLLELLSAKRVQSFCSLREEETLNFIESIRSYAGSPINLAEIIFSLTSAVTSRAAFGAICRDKDALVSVSKEAIALAGGFVMADLFPSLKILHLISGLKPKLIKVHRKADKILDNIINEHKKNRNNKTSKGESGEEDLVDVLLRVQESSKLEFPITTDNIKAVIWDMFSAGTDSSSKVIEWAMSEMIRNPRVMEKAQAEVRQGFKGKKKIHEADIQELSYLKSVIKETLRLHPSAPLLLPRECREQCEIGGYTIPVKTTVIINGWAIARDPEYWDDAENFVPERFSSSSVDFKGNHFEFIPFGAGRRICPGLSFAIANMELPLAQLLYHFDWKLPGGIKPEDLDMTEGSGASVKKKNTLFLIATSFTPSLDEE